MKETKKDRLLRIGELAAALDLNPGTLRYYEEIGLLPEPQRTLSSYRLYSEFDHDRLRFILKAKAVGLTLSEIKDVLDLRDTGQEPCEHVLNLIDQKLAKVDEQLRVLNEFRADLSTLRNDAAQHIGADACVCGIIEFHASARRGERGISAV
ncbi:MAG: heavy metal-responsive transcriptional regulator [Chloroflexota bacterium]|nr:heavy metal-responsive transcriptional regulator [Chloroflexota bacterium]